MNQRLEEFNQKLIASLLAIGVGLFFLGCFGLVFFFNPKTFYLAVLCVILAVGGVALVGASIFYGITVDQKTKVSAEVVEPNCRVMARYGVDDRNEIITADWAYDSEGFRPFVRIHCPTRGAMELECAMPVWEQCGEGMLGEAVIQGRWLSSFRSYVGSVQVLIPPQNFP